jgi:hypothetical protein
MLRCDLLRAVTCSVLQLRDLEARLLEEREEKAALAGGPPPCALVPVHGGKSCFRPAACNAVVVWV